MTKVITRPPDIKQAPRTASDTAMHYGYCAYKDIQLAGSTGLEYKVQPAHSPYYRVLPARELIPFTNIEVGEPNEIAAATGGYDPSKNKNATKIVQKTAGECAKEMEIAREPWGFAVLRPITGYSEEDAFAIFQTVQPFAYKLRDILDELEDGAQERIAQTEAYSVTYGEYTVELEPLRAELRPVAEKVRGLLYNSAKIAVDMGEEVMEKTIQSLNSFHAGGPGKKKADPHDKYIFDEFETDIPKLVTSEKKDSTADTLKAMAEILTKKDSESSETVKAKEAELDKALAEVREQAARLESLIASQNKTPKPSKAAA